MSLIKFLTFTTDHLNSFMEKKTVRSVLELTKITSVVSLVITMYVIIDNQEKYALSQEKEIQQKEQEIAFNYSLVLHQSRDKGSGNLLRMALEYFPAKGQALDSLILLGAEIGSVRMAGARVRQVDLRGSNLMRADLRRWEVIDADFSGAGLSGANLSYINNPHYDEPEKPLPIVGSIDFRQKLNLENEFRAIETDDLYGIKFFNTRMAGVNLYRSDLRWARFVNADMRRARLTEGKFHSADFTGADLLGANISGADFGTSPETSAKITQEQLNSACSSQDPAKAPKLLAPLIPPAKNCGMISIEGGPFIEID